MIKDHIKQKKAERLRIAKSVCKTKSKTPGELYKRMERFNIEADYPEEYLHIQWSVLRLIVLNHDPEFVHTWTDFKQFAGKYNLDESRKNEYLHIDKQTLRLIIGGMLRYI